MHINERRPYTVFIIQVNATIHRNLCKAFPRFIDSFNETMKRLSKFQKNICERCVHSLLFPRYGVVSAANVFTVSGKKILDKMLKVESVGQKVTKITVGLTHELKQLTWYLNFQRVPASENYPASFSTSSVMDTYGCRIQSGLPENITKKQV